ncbi:MAG: ABC-type transporter, integral rane subunit [Gemmatimonadetes bacterium]|nr:ABC-type transporter, integral rane subunit [Gemmatimonadota bacterium]
MDGASVRRRLVRDTRVRIALVVLAVIALSAILAPHIAPYDPKQQLDITHLNGQPPSLAHPFGTDPFSRDVLSRLIFGTRVSLAIALSAVAIAMTFGTLFGAIAGYVGGTVDAVLMRIVDAAFSIPTLLLLIVVIALWGDIGIVSLTLLIASIGWFTVSRLVRAETLVVRNADYVVAARALGMPGWRVLVRHVLPNVVAPAIIASTLAVGNVILLEAGLSFLGIGVRPPTPSWGSIIQDGSERVSDLWWLTVFPGLAILITVFACNALGDALRDALDSGQLLSSFDDAPLSS